MAENAPSTLEHALLGLLRQRPKSGYDLRKEFSSTPMRHFSDSPGSIYPALRRLEERGLIRPLAEDGNGRGKQRYTHTRQGEMEFRRWLAQPIERADIVWRINELLLRFAFMGGTVSADEIAGFLEGLENQLAAYLRELRAFITTSAGEPGSTGYLAVENGVATYRAHAQWARRALSMVRRSHETLQDV